MKKYFFIIIALFAANVVATAQENSKSLYIVNGKIVPKEVFKQIPPDSIKNINIAKNIEEVVIATTRSADADNKTIVIHSPQTQKSESTTVKISKEGVVIVDQSLKTKALIVVQNGKGEKSVIDDLNKIKPEDIKSMSVLKNKDAAEQFDKFGDTSNGVIYIILK